MIMIINKLVELFGNIGGISFVLSALPFNFALARIVGEEVEVGEVFYSIEFIANNGTPNHIITTA
ncbi:hypothetical protein TUM4433_12280 [Shewanella schlegeliana]|nr:hypothetical protein TUM4433_12280 [Shewanella schlegeliana]